MSDTYSAPGTPPRRPLDEPTPSVGELLGEVTKDLSVLLRQEVELAKAELREQATQAGRGVAMFAGAAVAGQLVLLFVSIALWWALGDAIGLGWSALVVAALWAIVAAALAARGRAETRRVTGMRRTADTVKKIPNALQGQEESNR
jgi:hypothetical protein